jgi:cell division septation protein DedD
MFTHLENKSIRSSLVAGAIALILAAVIAASPSFAAGKLKTYEDYVASIPKGSEPVPRACFDPALKGKTLATSD